MKEELELLRARNQHAHTLLEEQADRIRSLERQLEVALDFLRGARAMLSDEGQRYWFDVVVERIRLEE